MARPPKDKRGLTEKWRMTTLRLPRWLADQVRDQSAADGFEEAWEILLRAPKFRISNPLPSRYRHHGPAIGTGPLLLTTVDVDAVVIELQAMGVTVDRVGERGLLSAEAANWRFHRADDVDAALAASREFAVKVREAVERVRARGRPNPHGEVAESG